MSRLPTPVRKAFDAASAAIFQERGVTTYTASDADRDAWRAAGKQAAEEEWVRALTRLLRAALQGKPWPKTWAVRAPSSQLEAAAASLGLRFPDTRWKNLETKEITVAPRYDRLVGSAGRLDLQRDCSWKLFST